MAEIKVIYNDDDLIILDKPVGILVHPTEAKEPETLVSWLINKYPQINKLSWPDENRAGIVHRLDKDTSGLIILAKNPDILKKLQEEFRNRKIKKTYVALVLGKIEPEEGKIEAAIIRGKAGRQKVLEYSYSFSKDKVRPAKTYYKVIKYYRYHDQDLTLVEVKPQTGRMHQIRVHLKHLGHPIIGDPLYNTKESRKLSKKLELNRQFLQSEKLEFVHPKTGMKINLSSDLPNDLKNVLSKLEEI